MGYKKHKMLVVANISGDRSKSGQKEQTHFETLTKRSNGATEREATVKL